MSIKRLKKEIFYLRKAFFEYGNGFAYLYKKYFLAQKIYHKHSIEKPVNNHNLSLHVLTGKSDFTMLLWSLHSFYQQMSEIGQLYIHNDGTLTPRNFGLLKKYLPSAKIVQPDDVLRLIEKHEVIQRFRTQFPKYFLLKKIIDTFFISDASMHLIIDSDLYWFAQPTELEQEIKNGAAHSLAMKNSTPCYVYFKGSTLSEDKAMVNTGVVLYRKDNFNLQKLSEYLNSIDTTNEKNDHFIEQAGFASVLENLHILPEGRYSIKGKVSSETVVRHYTSPRRLLFFTEALPIAIKNLF